MKKILIKIYMAMLSFFCYLFSKIITINVRTVYFSIKSLFDRVNARCDVRIKYMSLDDIVSEYQIHKEFGSDFAILLTGLPFRKLKRDVTIDTLAFYRKQYPNITIIVSTWKGQEYPELLSACEKFNICLLLNEEPFERNGASYNHQIISARLGIKKALSLDAKWIFKTRTDQRFYKSDLLNYFISLEKMFPVKNTVLEKRFIVLGAYNSFKFYPFFLSDFMIFGTARDLANFYDIPFENGELSYHKENFKTFHYIVNAITEKERGHFIPIEFDDENFENEINKQLSPECLLYKSYYEKNIAPYELGLTKSIDKYHCFLKKYCIVVDENQVLFDWPKDKNIGNILMTEQNRMGKLDFTYWLNLYNE